MGPCIQPTCLLRNKPVTKQYPDTACAATPSITLGDLHSRQPDVQPYDLPHTHTHSLDKACTLSTTQQVTLGTLFAAYAHTHNHGQSSQQQATGSRSCVLGDKSHGKASLPTVQHQLQCQHADHALKVAQVCWTRPEESRHGLVRTIDGTGAAQPWHTHIGTSALHSQSMHGAGPAERTREQHNWQLKNGCARPSKALPTLPMRRPSRPCSIPTLPPNLSCPPVPRPPSCTRHPTRNTATHPQRLNPPPDAPNRPPAMLRTRQSAEHIPRTSSADAARRTKKRGM